MKVNFYSKAHGLFVWAICGASALHAQDFVNGDLNGTVATSSIPTNWSPVPYTDPMNMANAAISATADVTSLTGPVASAGINGNPYSGTTFVTGLNLNNGSYIYHEGIEQTVSGLTVGATYAISFRQTVTKQSNALDDTGTWAVYRETTLIGQSAPTTSTLPWGSNSRVWELRVLYFTASSTSHTIKFLPTDDDANIWDVAGVRMGLDSVRLRPAAPLSAPVQFQLSTLEQGVQLDWLDAQSDQYSHYIVEHSADGHRFEPVGQVPVEDRPSYRFVDEKPFVQSYYRIASVGLDGGKTYSEVQQISTQSPLQADLSGRMLEVSGGYGGPCQVDLMDLQGRTTFSDRGTERFDLSHVSPGIYFLRVISEGAEKVSLEKKVLLTE